MKMIQKWKWKWTKNGSKMATVNDPNKWKNSHEKLCKHGVRQQKSKASYEKLTSIETKERWDTTPMKWNLKSSCLRMVSARHWHHAETIQRSYEYGRTQQCIRANAEGWQCIHVSWLLILPINYALTFIFVPLEWRICHQEQSFIKCLLIPEKGSRQSTKASTDCLAVLSLHILSKCSGFLNSRVFKKILNYFTAIFTTRKILKVEKKEKKQ